MKSQRTHHTQKARLIKKHGYLGLDIDFFHCVIIEPGNVQLGVEVTNIAHNCVVLKQLEDLTSDDVIATSGGYDYIRTWSSLLHGSYFVACANKA